jgi:hypothetical protein
MSDDAMPVEIYGSAPENAKGRYRPAECTGARKEKTPPTPFP